MLVAIVALALSGTVAAQAAGPAKPAVVGVRVEAAASADASAKAAADELRAAIAARKDEFRVVKAGEKAELVVRIDAVKPPADGKSGMAGALVKGQTTRPFSLAYPGDLKALSAALARNLRDLADEIKPSPKAVQ
jgi:phage tail sheath gpL-like